MKKEYKKLIYLKMNEGGKFCSKCRCFKSYDAFSKCSSSKDGLQSYCRECNKQRHHQWRKDNREHLIRYM